MRSDDSARDTRSSASILAASTFWVARCRAISASFSAAERRVCSCCSSSSCAACECEPPPSLVMDWSLLSAARASAASASASRARVSLCRIRASASRRASSDARRAASSRAVSANSSCWVPAVPTRPGWAPP
eukprot:scaffold14091_cov121-Isochrysis_galbana.AAC.19